MALEAELRGGRATDADRRVARILERDDFARRIAATGAPISVSELLYPLMQAYDSVAVEADVELGGTDQLYNLLTGREVMQAYGLEPQIVLTTPLPRLLGRRRHVGSRGNYMALGRRRRSSSARSCGSPTAAARSRTGLRRSRSSRSRAATPWRRSSARALHCHPRVRRGGGRGGRGALHASRARGQGAGGGARGAAAGRGSDTPPERAHGRAREPSTSEARRLIAQGGVKMDGELVTELDMPRDGSREPSSRRGSAASRASRPTRPSSATIPEPPRRGWRSLQPTTETRRAEPIRPVAGSRRASGVTGGFFRPETRGAGL